MRSQSYLFQLQDEYLLTRSAKTLDLIYRELLPFAEFIIKSKSTIHHHNLDELKHDMATGLIERFLKDNTFAIQSTWITPLYNIYRDRVWGKKQRKFDREEELSVLEGATVDAPHWDFNVDPIRKIIDDHEKGKLILYLIYKNYSVTETVNQLLELGITKQWIRDHAQELFHIKRILRRGGKVCQILQERKKRWLLTKKFI